MKIRRVSICLKCYKHFVPGLARLGLPSLGASSVRIHELVYDLLSRFVYGLKLRFQSLHLDRARMKLTCKIINTLRQTEDLVNQVLIFFVQSFDLLCKTLDGKFGCLPFLG